MTRINYHGIDGKVWPIEVTDDPGVKLSPMRTLYLAGAESDLMKRRRERGEHA